MLTTKSTILKQLLKNFIYPNEAPWGLKGLVCCVCPNPLLVGDAKPVFWFCAMLPKLGELLWAAKDANAVDGCWAAAPKPKLWATKLKLLW